MRLELRGDASFRADVVCDLDALALGVESGADSVALASAIEAMAPAERDALVAQLVEMLQRRLRVRFDGEPAVFEVSLPERGQARPEGSLPSALGLVARLSGRVPARAREVSFFASRAFPPVRLEIVDEGGRRLHVQILQRGAESTPGAPRGGQRHDPRGPPSGASSLSASSTSCPRASITSSSSSGWPSSAAGSVRCSCR